MLSHALSISSPKKKEDFEVDPFSAAIEENRRRDQSAVNRTRSRARSLSPMRVSDVVFAPEDSSEASVVAKQSPSAYSAIMSAFSGERKWRLKDLLLFRSASEGRAQGLLGCLGFAPGVHEVSRRFGSWSRASASR